MHRILIVPVVLPEKRLFTIVKIVAIIVLNAKQVRNLGIYVGLVID